MLVYAPDPNATELFTPYSDSDYAGDSDSAKSTSGMGVATEPEALLL